MTWEHLHALVRVVSVLLSTIGLGLLTYSMVRAFRDDYGLRLDRSAGWRLWRWRLRKRPGVNGRSTLDLLLVRFFFLLAVLGLWSSYRSVDTIVIPDQPLPINSGSLLLTAYSVAFADSAFRIWRAARKERLTYSQKGIADA